MNKATFILAGVLLAATSPAAFAFQPLITDDTGTQGEGGNQIEFSINNDRERQAGEATRILTLPGVYTRGLTDAIDIFVSAGYVRIRSAAPGFDASGSGNSALGAKWRFYENEESKISAGAKPEIAFPVTEDQEARGLGAGRACYGLTLMLTQEVFFGAVHANLFLGRDRYRNPGALDVSTRRLSIAPVWGFAEEWKAALDVGAEEERVSGASVRSKFVEIGAIYSPGKDIDFALGIIRASDDAQSRTELNSATLGVTWRFR